MFYFLGGNMDNLLDTIEEDYAKFYGIEYIFILHNNIKIELKFLENII